MKRDGPRFARRPGGETRAAIFAYFFEENGTPREFEQEWPTVDTPLGAPIECLS